MRKPLLGVVGGIATYTVSTIIFIIGVKMAGQKYFHLFSRWMVRIVLEKILGKDIELVCDTGSDDKCSLD